MKPTVGRIVHLYMTGATWTLGEGPHAAIVTAVTGDTVTLWAFFPAPGTPREITGVHPEGTAGASNYWTWPPREG